MSHHLHRNIVTCTILAAALAATLILLHGQDISPCSGRPAAHQGIDDRMELCTTGTPPMRPSVAFTPEQQEFVDWAYARYKRAGLEIGEIPITFHETSADCYGFGGVYMRSTRTVRVCQMVDTTMIHELAHAWLESSTLDQADRDAFLAHRELESWADSGSDWDQRGAEQAAEVLTWGLMDRNIQIRWLTTSSDGGTEVSYRLFKIPESDPDQLAAAYHALTGNVPIDRLDDDPRNTEEAPVISPEAMR